MGEERAICVAKNESFRRGRDRPMGSGFGEGSSGKWARLGRALDSTFPFLRLTKVHSTRFCLTNPPGRVKSMAERLEEILSCGCDGWLVVVVVIVIFYTQEKHKNTHVHTRVRV